MTSPSTNDLNIEMIEPFSGGAMVQFAHNLCNALAHACARVAIVSGEGFELAHLDQRYTLLTPFNIPRPDLSRSGSSAAELTAVQRSVIKASSLRRFVWQYFRATSAINRRQPDFVIVGTVFRYPLMPFFLGRMKRNGVRCVQFCHEFEMREASKRLTHRVAHVLNRNVYENFDTIFFLADKQRELFAARHPDIDAERLFVVSNGNYDFFHDVKSEQPLREVLDGYGLTPRAKTILFFGRVREDKGVEDLVRSFAALLASDSLPDNDVQLLIVGDTPTTLRADLEKWIDSLGLSDHVSLFGGYVKNEHVAQIFEAADLAVFPYRSGTQSGPLQIAMTMGVPVIVSDVGGLPEVVQHGDSGLVVESRNQVEIVDAMRKLLLDDSLSARFVAQARERSEALYSWENLAQQVVEALTRSSDVHA